MGLGLIAGTILAHVVGIHLLLTLLDRWLTGEGRLRPSLGRVMVFASLALAVLHHVEASLWAAVYIGLGVFADWDTAVYFSIVTMTSVGYGDVVLSGDWRLLAAFQAMDGLLLFGISTAFLFAVLQQCWRSARGRVRSDFASSHKE
jgi:voltage-gated potassium channel Kch